MVLYRKYRPQQFTDIIGQEHIVRTLTNTLTSGNFSHGYLFSGPRGSGKTTIARIFAKALNCTGRTAKKEVESCEQCSTCQMINEGKSMDIIEIDAASNRGIDEIRELKEKIRFAPTNTQYKIYIIDEVHMLTKEAFNALLKTLEEPPKHAIFIMATTEPHKVLPTILSRVQRFDFHKATVEELSSLIEKVAKREKINIQADAIMLIARLSFGAYRDALSLLDQVSSAAEQKELTVEVVQSLLGLGSEESVFQLLEALAAKDRKAAFKLISDLYFQGVDFEYFTGKVVEILRKLALFKLDHDQTFDLTKEQQNKIQILAGQLELEEIMKLIEKFLGALAKIKSANLPQLPLEMIIFEETKNLAGTSEKIPAEKISSEKLNAEYQSEPSIAKPEIKLEEAKSVKVDPIEVKPSAGIFDHELWPEVIKKTKVHNNTLAAILRDAVIKQEDERLTLAFKFKFHSEVIAKKQNTEIIEKIIEDLCGNRYALSCVVDSDLKLKKPVDKDEALIEDISEVFEL